AAVAIHLCPLRLRPGLGYAAALDGRLLVLAEPGPPGLDHGGVHDLPAHSQVAGIAQHCVEALEPGARPCLPGSAAHQTARWSWHPALGPRAPAPRTAGTRGGRGPC